MLASLVATVLLGACLSCPGPIEGTAGDDHVWAYYLDEDDDFIDCGPGFDVLHLHQNLHDLSTLGCEEWDVQIAG